MDISSTAKAARRDAFRRQVRENFHRDPVFIDDMASAVATAMARRRQELISQPIDRIWRDLALAALETLGLSKRPRP